MTVQLDYQVHFVDFETNDEFVPPGATIDGPVQFIEIALVYRF